MNWTDFEHACPNCGAPDGEENSEWDTDGFRTCKRCGEEWNVVDPQSWVRVRQADTSPNRD